MFKIRMLLLFVAISTVAGFILAGCGAGSSSSSSNGYGPGSGGSSTAAPSTQAAIIKTAAATVNGKSVTILTAASGKALYYFTPDSASSSACTSSCASTWPPLLSSSGSPTSTGTLSGTLDVITDANGSQVVYNGHPLYTYSGDTASGQMNGEGLFGKWFVATTDLAVQSSSNSGASPSPTSGHYGY